LFFLEDYEVEYLAAIRKIETKHLENWSGEVLVKDFLLLSVRGTAEVEQFG